RAVALLLRALFDGARELVHLDEEHAPRLLPQELGELEHAFGLGLAGRLAVEEAAQEADRLDALVVARLLRRDDQLLQILRQHGRIRRRRSLADVQLGRRTARRLDVARTRFLRGGGGRP